MSPRASAGAGARRGLAGNGCGRSRRSSNWPSRPRRARVEAKTASDTMTEAGTTLEAADIAVILKSLPHRYPFLMVDRVINIRGDQSGVGIKNVTANEPQVVGHFPDSPVSPGVLTREGMAHTGGLIRILAQNMGAKKSVFFLTIDKAKFRKPVTPGDTIEYHMSKMAKKKNMLWYRGEAKVAGQVVAEAEVGAMVVVG